MPSSALLTAEDLLHVGIHNKRIELVKGVLYVREPAEYTHGALGWSPTRVGG